MSAQTVWNRICSYRESQASTINTKYGYDLSKVILTLSTYPERDAYHGHASGKSHEPENAGTKAMLDAAIKWLMDRVPASVETQRSGPDPVRRAQGQNLEAALLAAIPFAEAGASIAGVRDALNALDPNWKNRSSVKAKYNILAGFLRKPLV
jgi:hypothetical protein